MLTKEKQEFLQRLVNSGKNPFLKGICIECGGYCCKTEGCIVLPFDISPFTATNICNLLEKGYYSIRAFFEEGKAYAFLTSREIGQGVLEILSPHHSCSHFTENGCMFSDQDRPSGGISLIPHRNCTCENALTSTEIENAWKEPAVVSVMTEVLKKYLMNHSLEKVSRDLFKAFEYSVSNGTCSYNFITKYCIYHDGLRFGYKFKEGFADLIHYT